MTWNHRVLRYADGTLGIHEVFYEDGEPTMCTEQNCVAGDNIRELIEEVYRMEVYRMRDAADLPILNYEDF